MKYTATQSYKSSYLPGGIAAGEVIDLTESEAEDINRDAPGTLVPFVEPVEVRKQEPAENRMVTKSHNRKAAT
jgi:hypothetical protein